MKDKYKMQVLCCMCFIICNSGFSQMLTDKYKEFTAKIKNKCEDDVIGLCNEYIANNVLDSNIAEVMYTKADAIFNRIGKMKWNYRNLVKYDDVIELLENIIQKYPENKIIVDAKYLMYQCYEKQANYKKSKIIIKEYMDALIRFYGKQNALLIIEEIGDNYCKESNIREATCFYLLIESSYESTNERYYYVKCKIAQCYEAENKAGCKKEILKEIITRYEEISIQKNNSRLKDLVVVKLISLYYINYDKKERINKLKKLIDLSDKDTQPKIKLYLGDAYLYDNNDQEAKREYKELIDNYPAAPEVFAARKHLLDMTKKLEEGNKK